jgi:hypothetical protein
MTRLKGEALRARIASLAELHSADQIAARLMMDAEDVAEILERFRPRAVDWIVQCNRTGRWWAARTQRGAYRRVCLEGLTDWDCWGVPRGAARK